MGEQRITGTERPLRQQIAETIRGALYQGMPDEVVADMLNGGDEADSIADAVLPFIEAERVRVVEGLVATIKALPNTPLGKMPMVNRDQVLAVVEAAREDTP